MPTAYGKFIARLPLLPLMAQADAELESLLAQGTNRPLHLL